MARGPSGRTLGWDVPGQCNPAPLRVVSGHWHLLYKCAENWYGDLMSGNEREWLVWFVLPCVADV